MANPVGIVTSSVSIVQGIINLSLKIKNQVDTFRHNREDCRRMSELVATVRGVAEGLQKGTEGDALVGGALKALKQALERAWDVVVACQKKNAVLRALDADGIAERLRRVYLDVSLNLSAVVLANSAYNTSKLADINGIVAELHADGANNTSKLADIYGVVAALRADVSRNTSKLADVYATVADLRAEVAYNTRMLAKIREIVAALPEHLRDEVARLLESYSDSNDDDASYYQNENKRETKKAETKITDDVVSTRAETKKTETNKTDDVARYPTYPSSYAYPSYYGSYQQGGQHRYTVPGDQQRYAAAGSLSGGVTTSGGRQEFTTSFRPWPVQSSYDYQPQTYDGYQRGQHQYTVPGNQQRYGVAVSLGEGATAQDFATNVHPPMVLGVGEDNAFAKAEGSWGGGAYGFAGSHMGGGAPRPQYRPHGIPHSLLVPGGTWGRVWRDSTGEGWERRWMDSTGRVHVEGGGSGYYHVPKR